MSRQIGKDVAQTLWLGGDKRGAHTCLDNPFKEASKICGEDVDDEVSTSDDIPRTLDFNFDFVEIRGGAAGTSFHLVS